MRKVAEPDPVQKKLRQDKAAWNKGVSAFINDLIHFKKLMNGWPNKFYQQRSKIVDPVPADPATIIGSLAGDFQELAQRGNALLEQQASYSQTRRKKQPKGLAPAAPGPVTPPGGATPPANDTGFDLAKQLGASNSSDRLIKIASNLESKYDLVSEGSNPVTRFFARLFNPKIGFGEAARIRRARMELLSSCVKVYKKLEKLQVNIVRSSPESIDEAWKLFSDDVWKNWNTVRTGFKTFKGLRPQGVQDSGGLIKTPKELEEEKKKQQQEAAKLEKKMDQVDQAEQAGKPGPDDARHEPEPEDQPPPSWAPKATQLLDQTGSEEQNKLANIYLNDYIKNWQKLGPWISQVGGVAVFDNIRTVYEQYDHWVSQNRDQANALAITAYKELVHNLNKALNTGGYSLQEIIKTKEAERAAQIKARDEAIKAQDAAFKAQQKGLNAPPPPKTASDQLEAIAQDFLMKWLGKKNHQMSLFDGTSNVRLQVFEVAEQARETVDQIMDHLEKDMKIETMDPLVQKVNTQLEAIRGMMVNLHQLRTVEKKKAK